MIMCRSETASDRLIRAQDTIRALLCMVLMMLCILGWTAYQRAQDVQVMEGREAYITALEDSVTDLKSQVDQLQGQVDAMQFEAVTQPASRGTARTVTMELTGYCACIKCCGKTDGITASGAIAQEGVTIAADSRYAFGTEMVIPGVGARTVQDRGGAIQGNRIDVYFSSHAEALDFGRRTAEVQVK